MDKVKLYLANNEQGMKVLRDSALDTPLRGKFEICSTQREGCQNPDRYYLSTFILEDMNDSLISFGRFPTSLFTEHTPQYRDT